MNANPLRRAFTLIELIVMLAVLVMMMALIFPAIQRARGKAARTSTCQNNMRQLGLGINDFLTKRRVYPPACSVMKDSTGDILDVGFGSSSRVGWSWIVYILPELEKQELYDTLRLREAGPLSEPPSAQGTPHKDVMNTTFDQLICPGFEGNPWRDPEAKTEAITNYKGMAATHLESLKVATPQHEEAKPGYGGRMSRAHPDGVMYPGSTLNDKDMAQDGASHTIFVCESVEQDAARWTLGMETLVVGLPPEVTYAWHQQGSHFAPDGFDGNFGSQSGVRKAHPDWVAYVGYDYRNKRYQDYTGGKLQAIYGPSSHHPGVVNHLFGDNSVRMINNNIDVALYMFLITRNGRDPAGAFFQ